MADLSPQQEAIAKADQMVAQACGIAVQDASDNLRNFNLICTTAVGVLMAKYVATQNGQYLQMMEKVVALAASATPNFIAVGEGAATVLSKFKSL